MSVHTIRIEQGMVSQPAQARGQSPIGVSIKAATFIQAGKQVTSGVISNIGYATGDYELQEKAETAVKLGGIAIGLVAAPLVTAIALGITAGFEVYKVNKTQSRNQYKQQQAQILTGKIRVNSGVYV